VDAAQRGRVGPVHSASSVPGHGEQPRFDQFLQMRGDGIGSQIKMVGDITSGTRPLPCQPKDLPAHGMRQGGKSPAQLLVGGQLRSRLGETLVEGEDIAVQIPDRKVPVTPVLVLDLVDHLHPLGLKFLVEII
jgi:hypothetical protein